MARTLCPRTALVFTILLALPGTIADFLAERGNYGYGYGHPYCPSNKCNSAVRGNYKGKADCSSYLRTTVYPCAVTKTTFVTVVATAGVVTKTATAAAVTSTVYAQSTTTTTSTVLATEVASAQTLTQTLGLVTATTSADPATTTLVMTETSTDTETSIVVDTSTNTITTTADPVTVAITSTTSTTSTVAFQTGPAKRDRYGTCPRSTHLTQPPGYACGPCRKNSDYVSACRCLGVHALTFTAKASTIVVTKRTTSTKKSTTTSTKRPTVLVSSIRAQTETVASTFTITTTPTVTVQSAPSTTLTSTETVTETSTTTSQATTTLTMTSTTSADITTTAAGLTTTTTAVATTTQTVAPRPDVCFFLLTDDNPNNRRFVYYDASKSEQQFLISAYSALPYALGGNDARSGFLLGNNSQTGGFDIVGFRPPATFPLQLEQFRPGDPARGRLVASYTNENRLFFIAGGSINLNVIGACNINNLSSNSFAADLVAARTGDQLGPGCMDLPLEVVQMTCR